MDAKYTSNQPRVLVGGMIGLPLVGYPLVAERIEIWPIAIVLIGGLLMVDSVVIFVSDRPPRTRSAASCGP